MITISPRLLRSELLRRCRLNECRGACCRYGAWVDRLLVDEIHAHSTRIAAYMPSERRNPADWFDDDVEADEHSLSGQVLHTAVFPDPDHEDGTACVFLRPDYKCALQESCQAAGEHPWRFKPFYCLLHPLELTPDGLITLYENDELLSEPASCLRPADHPIPLIETFEPELRYLLGDRAYAQLLAGDPSSPPAL
jgi:hypothetical protein